VTDAERFFRLIFPNLEQIVFVSDLTTSSFTKLANIEDLQGTENFFVINPATSRRNADVTAHYNFLIEMDSIPLEEQLTVVQLSRVPFTTCVYSGGKSYHFILSLSVPLESMFHGADITTIYKQLWLAIADKVNTAAGREVVDITSKNANRLSRTPGIMRGDNEQKLLWIKPLVSEEYILELYSKFNYTPTEIPSVSINNKLNLKILKEVYGNESPYEYLLCLKHVAKPYGMYHILFNNILWLLDITGVPKTVMSELLATEVTPHLAAAGYDTRKVKVALDGAYSVYESKQRKEHSV